MASVSDAAKLASASNAAKLATASPDAKNLLLQELKQVIERLEQEQSPAHDHSRKEELTLPSQHNWRRLR